MILLKDEIIKNSKSIYSNSEIAVYCALCTLYGKVDPQFLSIDKRSIGYMLYGAEKLNTSQSRTISSGLKAFGIEDRHSDLSEILVYSKDCYHTCAHANDLKKILEVENVKLRFALLRAYLVILSTFNSKLKKKIGYMSESYLADVMGVSKVSFSLYVCELEKLKVLYVERRGAKHTNVYGRYCDREEVIAWCKEN